MDTHYLISDEEIIKVVSPKKHVKEGPKFIVCKTSEWAIVALKWDNCRSLAIRWFNSNLGNPSSHGNPTWFIIPKELNDCILSFANSVQHIDIEKIKKYLNHEI